MIKLFNPKENNFNSAGIATLMPIKLIETKKTSLNGWFIDVELPMKYKDLVKQDMLAVIKSKSKLQPQAFRIKNIEYTKRKIKFQAEHVMFDARDYYLVDARPTKVNAHTALNYVNDRTDKRSPFTFSSNVNNTSTAYFLDKTLLEAIETIEDRWGGFFDANNWHIELKKSIGVDRGEVISYGKNLEDIKVHEDWSNVVTRIYPVGFDGVRLPEVYIDADVQYPTPYTKRIDFETEYEDDDRTEENLIPELRENALEYLEKNKYPRVNYEIKSDINQRMEIGDTVHVKHPLVDLMTEVQEYEYNVLTERVIKLVFGNYTRDVKQKFDKIKEDIDRVILQTSKQEAITQHQTDLINNLNKNGHVYIDDNQILILDKLPKENAKYVWRWNMGGLAFSENGVEGPFKQAWTIDGTFNTDFISAGSIMANHLSSDVGASLDLSSNTAINQIVSDIESLNHHDNVMPNLNGTLETYDFWDFGILDVEKTKNLALDGDFSQNAWETYGPAGVQRIIVPTNQDKTGTRTALEITVFANYDFSGIVGYIDAIEEDAIEVGFWYRAYSDGEVVIQASGDETSSSEPGKIAGDGRWRWFETTIALKSKANRLMLSFPHQENFKITIQGVSVWHPNYKIQSNDEKAIYKEPIDFIESFEIIKDSRSLVPHTLKFIFPEEATNQFGRTQSNETYSFRGRVLSDGNTTFSIIVEEYKQKENSLQYIKETRHSFAHRSGYVDFSIKLREQTDWVALRINPGWVSPQKPLYLTEMMFNKGKPKKYEESIKDVKIYAESQFKVQDNKINSAVEEIRVVDGKTEHNKSQINQQADKISSIVTDVDGNTSKITQQANRIDSVVGDVSRNGSQISQMKGEIDLKVSKNGVIGGINASPERVKIKSNRLEFDNAVGKNVRLTGSVTAEVAGKKMAELKDTGLSIYDRNGKGTRTGMLNAVTDLSTSVPGVSLSHEDQSYLAVSYWDKNQKKHLRYMSFDQHHLIKDSPNSSYPIAFMSNTFFYNDVEALQYIARDSHALRFNDGSKKVFAGRLNNKEVYLRAYEITPRSGGGGVIGSSSRRYSSIFLKNQPNVSSDLRQKHEIKNIPKGLLERLANIKPKQYEQEGKIHFGYLAQDVERELYKYCVDTYGFENAKEEMKKYAFLHKDVSYMSLLYGEIAVIKDAQREKEIKELRQEVKELKEMVYQLRKDD